MSRSIAALVLLALLAIPSIGRAAPAEGPTEKAEPARLRVGTFDSRAVVVAFAASKQFDRQLKAMQAKLEKAKKDGDQKEVDRLKADGSARQKQFHRQGFGAAPVDDILDNIKDQLPEIAKRAGVDVIVSKWAVNYSAPGAQMVDVTDLMVEPFEPGERTKRIIQDLRGKAPLPAEGIEKHHDD